MKEGGGRRWGQSPEGTSQGCHLIPRLQKPCLLLRQPLHSPLESLRCAPSSYGLRCSHGDRSTSGCVCATHQGSLPLPPTPCPHHTQVHRLAHLLGPQRVESCEGCTQRRRTDTLGLCLLCATALHTGLGKKRGAERGRGTKRGEGVRKRGISSSQQSGGWGRRSQRQRLRETPTKTETEAHTHRETETESHITPRQEKAHGKEQITGRKRDRENTEGAPEPLSQAADCWSSWDPGLRHEQALPESSVQGDTLRLMLTEVHPGHAVVNHLVAQLTWWGRGANPGSGVVHAVGHNYQKPCICSLGISFLLSLCLDFPGSDNGKIPGPLLGTVTAPLFACVTPSARSCTAETTGCQPLTPGYASLFLYSTATYGALSVWQHWARCQGHHSDLVPSPPRPWPAEEGLQISRQLPHRAVSEMMGTLGGNPGASWRSKQGLTAQSTCYRYVSLLDFLREENMKGI